MFEILADVKALASGIHVRHVDCRSTRQQRECTIGSGLAGNVIAGNVIANAVSVCRAGQFVVYRPFVRTQHTQKAKW